MKKIFTLSVLAIASSLFLTSCIKDVSIDNIENFWLNKEKGEVVYSDSYCNYFVVETRYGFNIIRSNGNYKPFEQNVVYGDFSYRGFREFYNRTTGILFSGTVTDYWLTNSEAQIALDYYCPIGKGVTREFKKSSFSK
jgi:hypothetical protein